MNVIKYIHVICQPSGHAYTDEPELV